MVGVHEFEDNDKGFLQWMDENEDGYVLNTGKSAASTDAVLHRSNCFHISTHATSYSASPFTTQDKIKVCATEISAIDTWQKQNRPQVVALIECRSCKPYDDL